MVARKFNIDINILSSQIDYAGGVKFGFMLAELHGLDEDIEKSITFLEEHHVKVEILGYV